MVKRNNQRKKPSRPNANRQQPRNRPQRAIAAVDSGAAGFARMLLDPCNAAMVAPVYSGCGTGEYRRFRRLFTVPATAVEGTYTIQPATNTLLVATHIAANAGTNYTFNGQDLFTNSQLGARIETRCLGACVKVRYIGAESARSGTIGLISSPVETIQSGDVRFASGMLELSPVINRIGEVIHEVKFTPGNGDESFTNSNSGGPYVTLRDCGSMTFTFAGAPPGSIQVEITAIMEIEAGTGLVQTSLVPSSKNTLNQVLHALGPPIKWAYSNVVAPTIRSVAGQAMQSISYGASTASASRLLLAL